jgi:MoxR-like ATPase
MVTFNVSQCGVNLKDFTKLQHMVNQVFISRELQGYIVDLVNATRNKPGVILGASPRASISLMKTASALALFDNQEFVTPDHIQEIAVSVIAHRLMLDPQSKFSGKTARIVVEEVIKSIPVPV